MLEVSSPNSGHCSAIPGAVATLWEPAALSPDVLDTIITTVLPTPHTSLVLFPLRNPQPAWVRPSNTARALTGASPLPAGPSAPCHVEHGGWYPPQQSPRRLLERQGRRRDLRKAKYDAQDNRTPGAMISNAPQCTFYSSCPLAPPIRGETMTSSPSRTCTPPLFVSIKGGGGLYLLDSLSLASTLSYDQLLSFARSFS